MKRVLALIPLLALGACAQAPDIADWPPKAPAVDASTVQKYVDIYAHEEPAAPVYTAEELEAINLLNRSKLYGKDRKEDDVRFPTTTSIGIDRERPDDNTLGYSRNEINIIERRAKRRFESKHDQRMEMKRYGL